MPEYPFFLEKPNDRFVSRRLKLWLKIGWILRVVAYPNLQVKYMYRIPIVFTWIRTINISLLGSASSATH